MPLVKFKEVLPAARREKRAVGAFNIANYETAVAVVAAAEAENRPVVMQIYQRLMNQPRIAGLAAMMLRLAQDSTVPVVVHLDHGASLAQVEQALGLGFSSVMFDGSSLPWAENVAQTREAVRLAAAAGASVEAELGHVPLSARDEAPLPTPEEAADFVRQTGIDALALAVGTVHGYYQHEPRIDVELGRRAAAAAGIPLVLHGGSGTPEAMVGELIRSGFAKVNVATEFQHCFLRRVETELAGAGGKFVPVDKLLAPAVDEATGFLRQLIRRFAAGGQN